MNLSPADLTAWSAYEAANRRALVEYHARPSSKPFVAAHNHCLCCDVLTVQLGVCLSCQSRSPEWAVLGGDHAAVAEFRRAGRQMSA